MYKIVKWGIGMYNRNDYMGQNYDSSSKISVMGILLAVIFGLIASIGGAFVYGLLINYVPFIYANILFAYFFGFGIAKAITFGAKLGHITNKGVIYGIGTIFILITEYFSWVFWIYVSSEFELLMFKLGDMIDIIKRVNIIGAWEIKGTVVTGTVLWIVWALEAVIIAYGILKNLKGFYQSNSYCSRCNSWVGNVALEVEVERYGDRKYVKETFSRGDFSAIDLMEPIVSNEIKSHWRLDLKVCDHCNSTYFLNVVEVIISNSKGKINSVENFVLNNVPADSSVYEKIESLIRSSREFTGEKSNNSKNNYVNNDTVNLEIDDINRYID